MKLFSENPVLFFRGRSWAYIGGFSNLKIPCLLWICLCCPWKPLLPLALSCKRYCVFICWAVLACLAHSTDYKVINIVECLTSEGRRNILCHKENPFKIIFFQYWLTHHLPTLVWATRYPVMVILIPWLQTSSSWLNVSIIL